MSTSIRIASALLSLGLLTGLGGCAGESGAEEADQNEGAASTEETYMIRPSMDGTENDAYFNGLKGLPGNLLPRTAEVSQKVGDSKIGIGCHFDLEAGFRLCDFFVPFATKTPIALPADPNASHMVELGEVTFAGPVAKKIFDSLRNGDAVRTAGPLTCKKQGSTASCTLAPKENGKREFSVHSMKELVATNKLTPAQAAEISALAQ